MEELVLNVELREDVKAKKIRKEGKIPGIVYSEEYKESEEIKFSEHEFLRLLHKMSGEVVPVVLKYNDGKEKRAIIKDIQKDALGDKILHVDFQPLVAGHMISVTVPLEFIGTPKGVQEGGLMEVFLHELEIEVSPDNIPHKLEIDISNIGLNESLHIRDLNFEGIKFVDPPETTILTILAEESEETGESETEGEGSEG